jgi:hypothetical protein
MNPVLTFTAISCALALSNPIRCFFLAAAQQLLKNLFGNERRRCFVSNPFH